MAVYKRKNLQQTIKIITSIPQKVKIVALWCTSSTSTCLQEVYSAAVSHHEHSHCHIANATTNTSAHNLVVLKYFHVASYNRAIPLECQAPPLPLQLMAACHTFEIFSVTSIIHISGLFPLCTWQILICFPRKSLIRLIAFCFLSGPSPSVVCHADQLGNFGCELKICSFS